MQKLIVGDSDLITGDYAQQFQRYGFLYIPNFYDLNTEITQIQYDIYCVIGLIIKEHRLPINQLQFSSKNFDSGLQELVQNFRKLAGVLYDAVKKLPSYIRLANHKKHEDLAKILLNSEFVGFANRGYGIRMDNPNEDKFITQWHQDYVSQLCSQKGVVFWSPLRDVTLELGPVKICLKSHHQGVFPIVRDGGGSYGLKIKNEPELISKYSTICPEVKVGDLVVIDYMTVHCSSPNRSEFTRWAMISRYFDFFEPAGISIGWRGGLQEGNSFEHVHPELFEIKN